MINGLKVLFAAILGLGNIAMAVCVLARLFQLPAGATAEHLLLRERT
jgi:hypothetical protein